MKRSYV